LVGWLDGLLGLSGWLVSYLQVRNYRFQNVYLFVTWYWKCQRNIMEKCIDLGAWQFF